MRVGPAPGYLSEVAGAVVANNNRLVLGAIGCLFLTGLFGLSCMGLGAVGYFALRTPAAPIVAAPAAAPAAREISLATHEGLLSDAAFLDVGAGPFAAPLGLPAEAEPAPIEPARPVIRPTQAPPRAPVATAPSEPEPPPAEDDQAPIISDEDVQALDAEVQQIEAEKAAEAATDTKKKKKNK
jgi:hypothetical protein